MAFEQGTAIDLEDLVAKISTFVQANGWTEDRRDNVNGIVGWSKNSMFISGRWDPADPDYMSLHQATAVLPGAGTEPGDVTGDSGNGYNTTTSHSNTDLDNERNVRLGNGAFPSYYIFEQDSGPAYVHIVVETSTNVFVHFGVGELNKIGDGWTGGEYCYGHHTASGTELSSSGTYLLDGFTNSTSGANESRVATMRITGFPGQIAGSVWGNVWGRRLQSSQPDDTAGNDKVPIQGGLRGGPFATPWGLFSANKTTGLIPMYSLGCFYVDDALNHVYFLGWQPDVRGVNIRSISPKEEVVIGSDTWVIFPLSKRDITNDPDTSGYSGVAYKKVTA